MYQSSYINSWALVIGINAYQFASPLSYACNDADAIASILIDELEFPSHQVILLKDGDATKTAILDNYLSFSTKADNQDDRVIVFFAGHGTTIEGSRGPIGYLIPVDGDTNKLSSLIRWDDLTRNAEIIPAKHVLFIIDACYSGLAIHRAITPGAQRFISDMLQRFSRQVITAGKADETVADGGGPEGNNSIFTGYLIEGLRGAAVDTNGVLTANLLMYYVYQKVGQDSRSQQTPHYGHIEGDGDFILRTPGRGHLKPDNQQDFLVKTVMEVPEIASSHLKPVIGPSFAHKNGYSDPEHPNFGRNEWSNRLGESRFNRGNWGRDVSKAFSWLSLIAEPADGQAIHIDIAQELERLTNLRLAGGQPYEQFALPTQSRTTIDSMILYGEYYNNREYWGHYLRLDKQGNLEYADSNCVFGDFDGIRHFEYVRTIGLVWQFMFLVKNILTSSGYIGGIRLLINLVGTRDSILGDFAKGGGENGKMWISPSDPGRMGDYLNLRCLSPNLQMEYKFILGTLDDERSQEIIKGIASQLGLAYNHRSSPRCFNFNTYIFPWQQYLNGVANCKTSLN